MIPALLLLHRLINLDVLNPGASRGANQDPFPFLLLTALRINQAGEVNLIVSYSCSYVQHFGLHEEKLI